ncbi:hypothetical protein [Sagittula sp. S175]|uniref:hypothetical protein n=1 Tax=Sagittula sp. S175 TaxID=3415129 RepID=UPI003C7C459A
MPYSRKSMHKDRRIEWWFATITNLFGCFLLVPAVSMDAKAFEALISWMPEAAWGFFFLATGAIHVIALNINGRAWWTPLTRTLMVALNTFIYAAFGVGIWVADPWSTGVFTYLVGICGAASICFYGAVRDSVHALAVRNAAS